ncbi:hypothetical protein LCGC14_0494850 [marine sediment metagenome]|uniref:Uncharacterized protein n=1 Tax=marine sediment metagenome TaxID=412755 RepID=A0A0F9VE24_9ZZZZ
MDQIEKVAGLFFIIFLITIYCIADYLESKTS